uniref:Polyprenyl synthetase family protein n=1 Tax=candidate division WOR-3 bacterium TaxID=2052148 RepID=A0A7C3J5X1_UNCW3
MSDFEKYLKVKKDFIDRNLKKYFTKKGKYSEKLYEAMYYSISAGGKRLRPVIFLSVAEELTQRSKIKKLLPAALSIEMIHTYSLIHDDLPAMDNDDLRRGKPTLHKKYDETVAILAGDALFAYAVEVFLQTDVDEKYLVEGLNYLIKAAGMDGMVVGQFVDTKSQYFKQDEKTLKFIHTKKTAELIKASFTLPAILLGCDKKKTKNIEKLGLHSGLLFQIVDDILDYTTPSQILGKTAGKDEKQNKLTYVSLYGIEKAKIYAKKESEKALSLTKKIGFSKGNVESIIELFLTRIN